MSEVGFRLDNGHVRRAMSDGRRWPSDWYMASPYTACEDPEWAWRDACRAFAAYVAAMPGHFVYSPIAETFGVERHGGLRMTHAQWMARDKTCVDRAGGLLVVMLPHWSTSKGVRQEIEWARGHGKPIAFLRPIGGEPGLMRARFEPTGTGSETIRDDLVIPLYHPDFMVEQWGRPAASRACEAVDDPAVSLQPREPSGN